MSAEDDARPFTAAQEARLRDLIFEGFNEHTRLRNIEMGERLRAETEAIKNA